MGYSKSDFKLRCSICLKTIGWMYRDEDNMIDVICSKCRKEAK